MPEIPNLEVQSHDGSFTLRSEGYRDAVVLAAGVAQYYTVPVDTDSNKRPNMVFFASEAPFFAAYTEVGGADVPAAIPGASTNDGSASDLNPTTRSNIRDKSKICLISRVDQVVILSFYQ